MWVSSYKVQPDDLSNMSSKHTDMRMADLLIHQALVPICGALKTKEKIFLTEKFGSIYLTFKLQMRYQFFLWLLLFPPLLRKDFVTNVDPSIYMLLSGFWGKIILLFFPTDMTISLVSIYAFIFIVTIWLLLSKY